MCDQTAVWTIFPSQPLTPDDCTEGCVEHVGYLLTDAVEHTVVRIFEEPADRAPAQCCFISTEEDE